MHPLLLLTLALAITSVMTQQGFLDCSQDDSYDSSCNGNFVPSSKCDLILQVTMNYGKTYACLEVFLRKIANCPGEVFKYCGQTDCPNPKNLLTWRGKANYYCADLSSTCPDELTMREGPNSYYYECKAANCPTKFGFSWQYSEGKWVCSDDSKNLTPCRTIFQDKQDSVYYCEANSNSNCAANYLIPSQSCQEKSCYEEYLGWSCQQKATQNSALIIILGIVVVLILVILWTGLKIRQKKQLEKALQNPSGLNDSYLIKNS